MGSGPCTFRKRDLKVAIEAALEAGGARVEVDKDGKITVDVGRPTAATPGNAANVASEWDEKYGDR